MGCRPAGLAGRGDRGKRLVLDPHQLGGVLGLGHRLGDEEGDRIADAPNTVADENGVRGCEHRRAVGPGPHEGRPRGAEPSLDEVIAREDRQHAGRATRRRHIDAHDAGVRVHGADDDRVRLARQAHVLVEASPATHETHVRTA